MVNCNYLKNIVAGFNEEMSKKTEYTYGLLKTHFRYLSKRNLDDIEVPDVGLYDAQDSLLKIIDSLSDISNHSEDKFYQKVQGASEYFEKASEILTKIYEVIEDLDEDSINHLVSMTRFYCLSGSASYITLSNLLSGALEERGLSDIPANETFGKLVGTDSLAKRIEEARKACKDKKIKKRLIKLENQLNESSRLLTH